MDKAIKHPGLIAHYKITEVGISQREFASLIQVAPSHLNAIFNGERAMTAEFAYKMQAAGFENAEFWLSLQMKYDLVSSHDTHIIEAEKISTWKSIQKLTPISLLRA